MFLSYTLNGTLKLVGVGAYLQNKSGSIFDLFFHHLGSPSKITWGLGYKKTPMLKFMLLINEKNIGGANMAIYDFITSTLNVPQDSIEIFTTLIVSIL